MFSFLQQESKVHFYLWYGLRDRTSDGSIPPLQQDPRIIWILIWTYPRKLHKLFKWLSCGINGRTYSERVLSTTWSWLCWEFASWWYFHTRMFLLYSSPSFFLLPALLIPFFLDSPPSVFEYSFLDLVSLLLWASEYTMLSGRQQPLTLIALYCLTLGGADIDVAFMDEQTTINYWQDFGQLWFSVVILTYCKKKCLWSRLREPPRSTGIKVFVKLSLHIILRTSEKQQQQLPQ